MKVTVKARFVNQEFSLFPHVQVKAVKFNLTRKFPCFLFIDFNDLLPILNETVSFAVSMSLAIFVFVLISQYETATGMNNIDSSLA